MRTLKRRRKEGKTDYKARLKLLSGNKTRVVVRKTNRYIIGQAIKSEESKDKVIVGVSSKMLLKFGWPKEASGSLKSIPAAYLTGYLLGKKMNEEDEKEAILDLGLDRNIPRGRTYSFLKGAVDAGIKVPHGEKVIPEENRLKGRHMKKEINIEKIKEKI